jgi:hypothetical protein
MRADLRAFLLGCGASLLLSFAAFGAEPEASKAEAKSEAPRAYITVAGAPGDGEQALAAALGRRLSAAGVKTATTLDINVFSVEAIVKMTAVKGGKPAVRIDWTVFGPGGDTLGGVSQTKIVRKGSLDRRWGATADAAARAAATPIAKLVRLSPPATGKTP